MLITLSRRTAICQSVAEISLTGVAPLGAVSHRFNLIFNLGSVQLGLGLGFNGVVVATRRTATF